MDGTIETYEILIDIAEESFRDKFLADRIAEIETDSKARTLEEASSSSTRPLTSEELAAEIDYWNSFVGPLTQDQSRRLLAAMDGSLEETIAPTDATAEDLVSVAKHRGKSDARFRGNLQKDELIRKELYSEVEKQVEKLKQDRLDAKTDLDRDAVAKQEKTLRNLTLPLAKDLQQDLISSDAEVARAAKNVRDELVAISDPLDILFSGLGVDTEVERSTNSSGRRKSSQFYRVGSICLQRQTRD